MTAPDKSFVERLGLIVGVALVLNMSFMTVAPYMFVVAPSAARLIDQQQTILQSIFMVLVGYLWGNSAGNKTKDNIIDKQTDTIKAAQEALAPLPVKADIELPEGESLNVHATAHTEGK